jgi:hypothetical protein
MNLADVLLMNTNKQVPTGSLALVVMAAGVVTACPEFTVETVGELTLCQVPDIPMGLGEPASSH